MASDKTERATPKRREEARRKGQVARSQEVNVAFGLLAAFGVLAATGGWLLSSFRGIMAGGLSSVGETPELTPNEAVRRIMDAGLAGAKIVLPFLVVGGVIGVLASAVQVKPGITPEAMKPRFSVLNPINGVKRLLSRRSLVQFAKDLVKLVTIGGIAYAVVRSSMPDLMNLTGAGPGPILSVVGGLVLKLGFAVAGVYCVIAIADVLFERHQHERDLRMTKDEVRREAKEQDLNPEVKGQMKRRQREMAMRRMMSAVPDADVVITNPTHYAVALRYTRNLPAPQVVAKGVDHSAFRIIALARESGVTVLQDPPLARSLYAAAEVGDMIPAESFAAVAEILAYVYRVGGKEPAAA